VVVLALGWFGLGECSKKTNASAATVTIEGICGRVFAANFASVNVP